MSPRLTYKAALRRFFGVALVIEAVKENEVPLYADRQASHEMSENYDAIWII